MIDIAAAKAAFKAGRNAIEMELGEVRAERDAALEALEEAQAFMEREFSNEGICLVCRAPKANHDEMSPSCWVMLLDRILRSKEDE